MQEQGLLLGTTGRGRVKEREGNVGWIGAKHNNIHVWNKSIIKKKSNKKHPSKTKIQMTFEGKVYSDSSSPSYISDTLLIEDSPFQTTKKNSSVLWWHYTKGSQDGDNRHWRGWLRMLAAFSEDSSLVHSIHIKQFRISSNSSLKGNQHPLLASCARTLTLTCTYTHNYI